MKTTTYKSDRAAKMAYTRAENAWKAKQSESWEARDLIRETMRTDGRMDCDAYNTLKATEVRCETETEALREVAREVYESARAQGFNVRSYHFSENVTRDLIAANMD